MAQIASLDSTVDACFAFTPSGITNIIQTGRQSEHTRNNAIQKLYETTKKTKELDLYASVFYIQKWHKLQTARWHVLFCMQMCAAASVIQKLFQILKRINIILHCVHLYTITTINEQKYKKQITGMVAQEQEETKLADRIVKWWLRQKTIAARHNLLKEKAIKIQRCYRMRLKAGFISECAKKYQAATIIQQQFRTFRKIQAINRYMAFYKSALLIQHWFKRQKNYQFILRYYRNNEAAKLIQSWYRRNKKARHILRCVSMNSAAVTIQRWFRTQLAIMKIMQYSHALVAAGAIQKWYSFCKKRRGLEKYLNSHSRSCIQISYKEYWKYARVYHLQRRSNSVFKDKYYEERKSVLQYLKMDASALVIQNWYRNYKKRKLILAYVNSKKSTPEQQTNYCSLTRCKQAIELNQEKLMKETSEMKQPLDEDAEISGIVSQKAYRAWSAIKRTAAAVGESLQSWFFPKNLDAATNEDSSPGSTEEMIAYTESICKLTKTKMCSTCATLKLSHLQSKIRIASLIFISEISVVMIQRWWRRMKAANAMLKEAEKLMIERIDY